MMLQGMKEYKVVYLNTIVGVIINACLDIPIILFLDKVGLPPYLGSLIATIIGQGTAIIIVLISLKKEFKFKYSPILKTILKTILSVFLMVILMYILRFIFNGNERYLLKLIKVGICGIISMGFYFFLTYKTNTLNEALGDGTIDKLLKKLKIKK
jgi:peptidoglycan biosynthesis protein MviN/MurJ (putative lipid II flippase)